MPLVSTQRPSLPKEVLDNNHGKCTLPKVFARNLPGGMKWNGVAALKDGHSEAPPPYPNLRSSA